MLAALDADHVRPQIGQKPRAERRRQHVAEVEDAYSRQGRRIGLHFSATLSMLDGAALSGSKAYVAALNSVKLYTFDRGKLTVIRRNPI